MISSIQNKGESVQWQGIWPVMLTPFDQSGQIDWECYRSLLQWYIDAGVHGIFALCGSSEMFTLNPEERTELVRVAMEVCNGQIPVIATGSLGDSFEDHKKLSCKLAELGVSAVILTAPDFCDTQKDLKQYYLSMADEIPCTMGVYEYPASRHPLLNDDVLVALAKSGRFEPFKDTCCEIERISHRLKLFENSPIRMIQANTALFTEACLAGASGLMGIAINAAPQLAVLAWEEWLGKSQPSTAHNLLCLVDALLRLGYPCSAKYIVKLQGINILTKSRNNPQGLTEEACKMLEHGLQEILRNSPCNQI